MGLGLQRGQHFARCAAVAKAERGGAVVTDNLHQGREMIGGCLLGGHHVIAQQHCAHQQQHGRAGCHHHHHQLVANGPVAQFHDSSSQLPSPTIVASASSRELICRCARSAA